MKTKRVLIISYYWPPSGGSGVQRWLKFSKYLSDFDWKGVIYTPANPSFDLKDYDLLNDVSDELEVLKTNIWEPYHIANLFNKKASSNTGRVEKKGGQSKGSKIYNWVRGNLFIPDPRKFWVKPSIKYLSGYLKQNPVDLIITTGPPHSMHLIALGLVRKYKMKWIMDVRDPWSKLDFLDNFLVNKRSRKKYEHLEKECLDQADAIIGTSWAMPEMLMDFDQTKYTCITNGFDEDDFNYSESIHESGPANLVLYHAGLLNDLRNPNPLWQVIDELIEENEVFKSKFRLHLVGNISSSVISNFKTYPRLQEKLLIEPYKSHDEVLNDYKKAKVLLLIINDSKNYKVNIPGKLFEYMAARKPILSFGKQDADANRIIEEYGLGHSADGSNLSELKSILVDLMESEKTNERNISRFSRKNLTKDLVDLMDSMLLD